MILERSRVAEHRHDPVAGEALNNIALLADRVLHQLCEALHQRKSGLLPGTILEGRKADHVGK
jgi:hypothetical protein